MSLCNSAPLKYTHAHEKNGFGGSLSNVKVNPKTTFVSTSAKRGIFPFEKSIIKCQLQIASKSKIISYAKKYWR